MTGKSDTEKPAWLLQMEELRKQIDRIDLQILDVINSRMSIVKRIGALKQQYGITVLDVDRETELLKSLVEKNRGPLDDGALDRIFREILSASKNIQKNGGQPLNRDDGDGDFPLGSKIPISHRADILVHCVIGEPVSHSRSPAMMNAAFEALGLPCIYTAFAVPASLLPDAIAGIRGLGIRGASITIPHKTSILPLLDEIDPLARQVGAVNTVCNQEGALIGYNTDAEGAIAALESELDLVGKTVAILGAGGAARAIGFGVRQKGADLLIANRSNEAGRNLAAAMSAKYVPLQDIGDHPVDVLINTTPVGMHPDVNASPVDASIFRADTVVMDAVYNPIQTRFLSTAQAAGCRTISGIEMFVRQGARQFEIWTGKTAPIPHMREAAIESLFGSKER